MKLNKNKGAQPQALESTDPFKDFGFGIIAYFKLLTTLMKVYLVMSLLMIVNLAIFRRGGAFDEESVRYAATLTLGNLGFSRSRCFIQYLDTMEARNDGDADVPLRCLGNHYIGRENITFGLVADYPG